MKMLTMKNNFLDFFRSFFAVFFKHSMLKPTSELIQAGKNKKSQIENIDIGKFGAKHHESGNNNRYH